MFFIDLIMSIADFYSLRALLPCSVKYRCLLQCLGSTRHNFYLATWSIWPMEGQIEELLREPCLDSQDTLKKFVNKMQNLIMDFEQSLYAKDDPVLKEQIKRWRKRLFRIIKENRQLPEIAEEGTMDALSTLQMVNKQKDMAITNQRLLDKGTLKLIGLNYTAKDIEESIAAAKKNLQFAKSKERKERKNLILGFLFFISVCIFILIDRLRKLF